MIACEYIIKRSFILRLSDKITMAQVIIELWSRDSI